MRFHLPFLLALPFAVIGMALSDGCGTFLVVAESRGHAKLAGAMDALKDLANILVTLAGVGEILTTGFTVRSLTILAAIFVTSYFGTAYWTRKAVALVTLTP